MSHRGNAWSRIPRWQKLAFLAPVVAAIAMWSSGIGSSTERDAPAAEASDLPDVPTDVFEDPASVTRTPPGAQPQEITPGAPGGSTVPAGTDPEDETVDGIPTAALVAYQRAEAVLERADAACHLPWELLAAIGRVESDHGRFGGNRLSSQGRATPGIFGIALDGRDGVALIADSDRGALDGDTEYDRAVGPMQFIPTTWEVVGVDGDADGERDPQDIDDAAVAAGVYLCAGDLDLSTPDGLRQAVHSYNHSDEYVAMVLAIMRSYAAGGFTEVDNTAPGNAPFRYGPADDEQERPDRPQRPDRPGGEGRPGGNGGQGGNGGGGNGGEGGNGGGDGGNGGGDGGGGNGGGGNGGGGNGGGDGGNDGGGSDGPVKPVEDTVTETVDPVVEATEVCTGALNEAGIDPSGKPLRDCIDAYLEGGTGAVDNLIDGLLDVLGDLDLGL